MAPSNKDNKAKEETETPIKKLKNQKQTTIFGIPNYKVNQKNMKKKVRKNQWKEVAKFVRVAGDCTKFSSFSYNKEFYKQLQYFGLVSLGLSMHDKKEEGGVSKLETQLETVHKK